MELWNTCFESLCFRVRLQVATHLFVCVPLHKQKWLFQKATKPFKEGERQPEWETDRESKRERGQVFFPVMIIVPALCLQTDTQLKILIGNGQQSIKSELSQSVVKRQTTEIAVCARVWAGGAFYVSDNVCLCFHANKGMHVCLCTCTSVCTRIHFFKF